jgi:4-hydroxy-tetrahydrodipicolinate synthase
MARLEGSMVAVVTPMRDGAPDLRALRDLVEWHVSEGTDGIVPCGTTGEGATLTASERADVVRAVVEQVRGRILVIAGAGSNATHEAIESVRMAKELRADAALVVTPYYNKPTPEGLYQHYAAIAGATSLPIIVYNVPGRTGVNVDPATLARLATIPRVVGVKEASGNVTQMAEICRLLPSDFIVLSGDDALTLPLMAIGGRGIISVASNEVPAEMVQLVEAAERGDFATARRWHDKLLPLMQVNFVEANPVPVKFAMAAMGLCELTYRLPMVPPRPASQEKILDVLKAFGLPIVEPARRSA